MYRAILVTHHTLGQSMIETVEKILGHSRGVEYLSNDGLSLDGIQQKLREIISVSPGDSFFLVTDMRGGSTYLACRRLMKEMKGLYLISGVSLPMLITFITKGAGMQPEKLLQTMKTDALRAIELVGIDI